MHSSIFVVLNRAIPGAPAARDGRSLALRAPVNLFTKGAGMASTAPRPKGNLIHAKCALAAPPH